MCVREREKGGGERESTFGIKSARETGSLTPPPSSPSPSSSSSPPAFGPRVGASGDWPDILREGERGGGEEGEREGGREGGRERGEREREREVGR